MAAAFRAFSGRWGLRFRRKSMRLLAASALLPVAAALGAPAAPKPTPTPPIQLRESCVSGECHNDLMKNQFLHGPMNLKQCEPCHVPIGGQHVFDEIEMSLNYCLTCHETEAPKSFVHEPFGEDCMQCHDAHGGSNRYFVKGGLNVEGCNLCHSDVREGLNHLHGPVAQGECLACHSPHQSDHEHLLVDPPDELCVACHVDFPASMEGAVSVHEAATKDCAGCHNAHGGVNEAFVKAAGRDLCRDCHADFLQNIEQLKYPHIPMAEGKSCENCHAAHSSMHEDLLRENDQTLCLSCHGETIKTDGKSIANIGEQLKNAKFLHGPLRQNNCSGCHAAHGSDFANILDKSFPDDFYAPYREGVYDLCFECHDRKIILSETGTADSFRNGNQSLHYLHVNREKGRSCRACHHEHAANQPFHMRDSVLFGRWTMDIDFNKTDDGGTCSSGCHQPYRYSRDQAVDNKLKPASQEE